ncbi:MAG: S-adenosylmethionine:tRNA ribosyltransferase-isomerase, partial [Candidatus Brocadiales bacterium]
MNANDERLAALYDYTMYKKLVAQHPLPKRDSSRLMVLNRVTGRREHRRFSDIVRYLKWGDALVLNNSQVIPARLTGRRTTGGSVKILLVNGLGNGRWRVLLETRGKPCIGEEVTFGGGAVTGTLSDRLSSREWVMDFGSDNGARKLMNQFGRMPLPPYIKRPATDTDDGPFLKEDIERYQSVFALRPGSIAAPTAGLHFTTPLLKTLERKGVEIIYVT